MQQAGQVDDKAARFHWRRWLVLAVVLLVCFLIRFLLWHIAIQLFCGLVVALIALPFMHLLERKWKPGLAAALSLIGLGGVLVAVALVFLPLLAQQTRQLLELIPAVSEKLSALVDQGERWLSQNGLPVQDTLRKQLTVGGENLISKAIPALFGWMQQKAGGFSRWMLAPVLGFYFLKDRKQIGEWLLLLVPVRKRSMSVRLLREVRRETMGFLRGQLMVSLAVGAMTAIGLLLCGIPAWLLLGIVMGIMELIPYVGPFVGGAVVVLFSLQAGSGRMLWAISKAIPALFGWMQQKAGGFSRWMLAPVLGFYFLKDRKQIGEWLLLLVPVRKRSMSVRLLREVRRETMGFLRGQLMVSLAVGAMTAIGLLLCGIPAWLLLGIVMGIMELIPYVGPFVGGAVVVLFSLQAGSGRMLWALAVVLVVQQLEGSWLSPQMMSDATKMHPIAVLLCLMAGGAAGGVAGILLAVPVFLCLRAALRVYAQHQKWCACIAAMQDVKER